MLGNLRCFVLVAEFGSPNRNRSLCALLDTDPERAANQLGFTLDPDALNAEGTWKVLAKPHPAAPAAEILARAEGTVFLGQQPTNVPVRMKAGENVRSAEQVQQEFDRASRLVLKELMVVTAVTFGVRSTSVKDTG